MLPEVQIALITAITTAILALIASVTNWRQSVANGKKSDTLIDTTKQIHSDTNATLTAMTTKLELVTSENTEYRETIRELISQEKARVLVVENTRLLDEKTAKDAQALEATQTLLAVIATLKETTAALKVVTAGQAEGKK